MVVTCNLQHSSQQYVRFLLLDVWHIMWIKFCKPTYLALLKTVLYIWSVCTRFLLFLLLSSLCIIWLSYSCSTVVRVLLLIIHSGFRVWVSWWIIVIILDGWPQHPMGTFNWSQGVNICRSLKKKKIHKLESSNSKLVRSMFILGRSCHQWLTDQKSTCNLWSSQLQELIFLSSTSEDEVELHLQLHFL